MNESTPRTQYGVRYPNGTEDWDVERTFGSIATAFQRQQFQEQYNLRLGGVGLGPLPVVFLAREVIETVGPTVEVEQEPAPEPGDPTP